MTAEREGLAEIAGVLAEHDGFDLFVADSVAYPGCASWWQSCACGERIESQDYEWHRAHLADALADLLAARDRRVRAEAVASILREVSDQTDSIGHHWSGAPAHAFFALAGDLRDRADRIEAER